MDILDINQLMRPRKLCICRNVTRADIEKAVRGGCNSFEKLIQKTNATTGCGTCHLEVKEVFEEYLKTCQKEACAQQSLSFDK